MPSIAMRLMTNPVFASIYERHWRPMITRAFSLGGTATAEYDRALLAYLSRPGDRIMLDVACGPGLFTAEVAGGLTGGGRCVGLDYSESMVASAARTNAVPRTAYIRGDAHRMPFENDSFDTVFCLAALYLMPDPLPVLDEMVRVTRPGGEVAVFASITSDVNALPGFRAAITAAIGYRFFEPDEITGRLRRAGLVDVEQSVTGQGQFVLGVKPAA